MTSFRPRLWTTLSAAVLLGAGGLAGCGGDGDNAADAQTNAPATASVGGEGEGEGGGEGGAGGEAGEAGVGDAYDQVAADSRGALRIAQLKGFVLVAQAAAPVEGPEAAAALVGQGMLEVFDPAAAEFKAAGVSEAALRKAAETGEARDLAAALASLNQASVKAGGQPAEVVKGMTTIASGLYGHVNRDGIVDPMEYQHAYGAALSAQAAAAQGGLTAAAPELDRFVKLWPSVTAPEEAANLTPAGQVLAQASRIELAL